MCTSIWCLLGGLKCLHVSILSFPGDVTLERLRKRSIHASCYTEQGLAAGTYSRRAGLGTRHVLALATTSVNHTVIFRNFWYCWDYCSTNKEGTEASSKVSIVEWLHELSQRNFYPLHPLFKYLLTNHSKSQKTLKDKGS